MAKIMTGLEKDNAATAAKAEWYALPANERTHGRALALFKKHGFSSTPGWTMPLSGRSFISVWEAIPGTMGHPYLTLEVTPAA